MNRERIESLVRDPQKPENAETAARVYADSALWPAFEASLYPDAEPTDEERSVIRRVVAERCDGAAARRRAWLRDFVARRLARIAGNLDGFALAASRGSGVLPLCPGEDDSSPDDTVTFVFVSEPTGGRGAAWRAEMTLPADAAVDTMLPIAIADGAGESVAGGVFKVAGVALPVKDGRAEIPYGMFLSGLKDAQVELVNAAGERSYGTLALF